MLQAIDMEGDSRRVRLAAATQTIQNARERLRKGGRTMKVGTRDEIYNAVAQAIEVIARERESARSQEELYTLENDF